MPIHADRVLYRDDHLLIVNKRAGELVVKAGVSKGAGELEALYDYLHKTEPGLRVVHRLDFGTSGILVFARTGDAAAKIKDSKFAGWKKKYRAIVAGVIDRPAGSIRKKLEARTHDELVDAATHYTVLEKFPVATYVEAQIDTGRKHQIRKHFAGIGHPLVLDPLYGDPKKDKGFRKMCHYKKFFLHAYGLEFPHPITGKLITIESPLPKAFEDALKVLRGK
jgi:23S rRNA pseudouridine1911/1915/1917 synthase